VGRYLARFSIHLRLRRQPDDACHDAGVVCRGHECKQKLKEIAAKSLGGKPEDYEVANQRVFRKGGGAGLSFAQAAQRAIQLGGIYDGHEAPDVNKVTKAAVAALAGQGLVVSARQGAARRRHVLLRGQLRRGRSGCGNRQVLHHSIFWPMPTWARCCIPTRSADRFWAARRWGLRTLSGRSGCTIPQYGVAVAKRFYQNRPPTILDVPVDMQWEALDIPDPETPVGARGVGEPPVGGGCAAILECTFRCAGRRDLPARAGECRHDSDVAGSGTSDATSLDGNI
jgi:xanthine dehydrogenase molybdenum-binding subunit